MRADHEARAAMEEKLEQAEQTMTNLIQENTNLQAKIKDLDEVWGGKLKETCKELEVAEAELSSLKKMITQMLTALIGKFNTRCFFLTRLFFELLPY